MAEARDKMLSLRDSLNIYDERADIINERYALTRLTRCQDENSLKFNALQTKYNYYKNFVALLKYEEKLYEETCVTMGEKSVGW